MIQGPEIKKTQERVVDPYSTIQTTSKIEQSHDEQIPEHKLNMKNQAGTDPNSQNMFFPTDTLPNISAFGMPANEVWAEIKLKDKSIQKRCYHVSFIYNSRFYVHGGYESNQGRLSDFVCIEINEDMSFGKWQKIEPKGDDKPKGLCRHTGTVWENTLYIFGGQTSSTENTNELWTFHLEESIWKRKDFGTKPKVTSLDSHCGLLYVTDEGEPHLIISCGFIGDNFGEYTNQTMSYNISSNKWEILFPHTAVTKKSSSSVFPSPRGGQAGLISDDRLYIFGGTEGDKRFNDMWSFNLKTKVWFEITYSGNIIPDPRNGHTLNQYDKDNFILFGGFQDIVHERDDLMIFKKAKSEWQTIEQESLQGKSIRKASPVESSRSKFPSKSPERRKGPQMSRKSTLSRSPQRSPDLNNSTKTLPTNPTERHSLLQSSQFVATEVNRSMTTINEETHQKYNKKKNNGDLNKMILLKNFEVNDKKLKEKLCILTPTTEAMRSSIEAIASKKITQNHQTSLDKDKEKDLNATKGSNWDHFSMTGLNNGQAVLEGKIWGKRPSARDGHTAQIHKGILLIFGGDRHKMTFNDIYIYNLEKVFDSPRLGH